MDSAPPIQALDQLEHETEPTNAAGVDSPSASEPPDWNDTIGRTAPWENHDDAPINIESEGEDEIRSTNEVSWHLSGNKLYD